MADLATLRRRRETAKAALDLAEMKPKRKGRGEARRRYIRATAAILEAELNRRIAAPLLRAQAAREQTGDLFSIGA